jgi:hypothetical protein
MLLEEQLEGISWMMGMLPGISRTLETEKGQIEMMVRG